MQRNTFLFLSLLAVFTALVVGVNIGRSIQSPANQKNLSETPSKSIPSPEPTLTMTTYASNTCGVSLKYPDSLTRMEASQGGALLVDTANSAMSVAIACQKDIPRPALQNDKIETLKIGSISAELYHDTSAKDGTPVDKLIFRHPKNQMDIFISGSGQIFQSVISSVTIF